MANGNGYEKVAAAVETVRSEIEGLKNHVSQIGASTGDIVECLLIGPPKPDLLTEAIEPTVATQDFGKKKLYLTLMAGAGAKERAVEVVFEGVETPQRDKTSKNPSGEEKLEFDLPELWQKEQAPRFVTVNIIDTTKKSKRPPTGPTTTTPSKRRILPATYPRPDEDDE